MRKFLAQFHINFNASKNNIKENQETRETFFPVKQILYIFEIYSWLPSILYKNLTPLAYLLLC